MKPLFFLSIMVSLFLTLNQQIFAQVLPTLGVANDYAIISGSSINANCQVNSLGKIGAYSSISNTISTSDSIISNNSGSVPTALQIIDSAISFCNNQSGTVINGNLSGNLNAGVYNISTSASISGNLNLIGNSQDIFVFNINGNFIIDSNSFVNISSLNPINIIWNVGGIVKITGNCILNGIIISVDSIKLKINNLGLMSIFSKSDILIECEPNHFNDQILYSPLNLVINTPCLNPSTFSCNYVVNGDFEYCQPGQVVNGPGLIQLACPWDKPGPNSGTSDYFNSNAPLPYICSVPTQYISGNPYSTQNSFVGSNAYAGFYAYGGPHFREYVQEQLFQPLVAGKTYYIEFWVSLHDNARFSVNQLGLLITNNQIIQPNYFGLFSYSPQVTNCNLQITDRTNWVKISGCYTAIGGEEFITIGNFVDDASSNPIDYGIGYISSGAYYFVDAVSIIELHADAGPDKSIQCGNSTQIGLPTCLTPFASNPFNSVNYSWLPTTGLSNSSIADPVASPCSTTVYTVTVTEITNCTSTSTCSASDVVTVFVTPPPLPSISGPTNIPCGGNITLTAIPNVVCVNSFQWSNGSLNQSIVISSGGIYTVTVTNCCGCSASASINITMTPSFSLIIIPTNCKPQYLATVDVTGGTPPYNYLWSTGAFTNNSIFPVNTIPIPGSGVYTVTVSDGNGCTQSTSLLIGVGTPLLTMSSTPECTGQSNGTATVLATSGITPYSYLWNNGQITQTAINLTTGNYTVTVTGANGCSATASVNVSQINIPPTPQILPSTFSNCHSGADFNLTNFSSYAGCTITWSATPANIITGSGQFVNVLFNGGYTGNASITVTVNCNGCIVQSTINLQSCCFDATATNPVLVFDANSAAFGPAFNPANTYYINGTFIINNSFAISNCPNIVMAPGSKIVVASGNTLNIVSSHLYAGCNQMWEGIVVGSGATINETLSEINDANNGINILPGAGFSIDHSAFSRNYIGINLKGGTAGSQNGIISYNSFDCLEPSGLPSNLLPPFSGQLPVPGTISLSGISADQILNLKINNCIFSYLANGISETNSNLYSVQNIFWDIGMQGFVISGYNSLQCNRKAIYALGGLGKNICNVEGTYVYNATGFVAQDFVNCFTGIYSQNNSNEIKSNSMGCNHCINIIGCVSPFKTHIFDNGMVADIFGIRLFQNTAAPQLEVDNNHIWVNHLLPSNGGRGILAIENHVNNALWIHHNVVSCVVNAISGILMNGTDKALVENNEVNISTFSPNSNAYYVTHCDFPTLKYNLASGSPANLSNNGFVTWASKNFHYECNHSNNTNVGFNFNMDCTSPENLIGNLMENYLSGLVIDNSGIMDIQNDKGNLWCGGSVDAACVTSNGVNPALSLFYGDNGVGYGGCSYEPPVKIFFNYIGPTGNPQDQCALPYPIASNPDEIFNAEMLVVQDSLITLDSSDAIEWLIRLSLYQRSLTDSNLATNALIQQFLNEMQLTNIPAFAAVKKQMNEIKKQVSTNDSLNQVILNQITANLSFTNILIDSIYGGNCSPNDSILFQTTIDSLNNLITNISIISDSLQLVSRILQENESDMMLIENAIIQANEIYEENEQRLNEIKLSTITRGIYTFTPQQISDIFDIGNQCPLYGGTAVLDAQGLYIYIDPEYEFDNNQICLQVVALRHQFNNPENTILNIFPVPTKDVLHVGFNLPLSTNAELCFYDCIGKRIKSTQLKGTGDYIVIDLDLTNIPSGIYGYVLFNNNTRITSGKIIISK